MGEMEMQEMDQQQKIERYILNRMDEQEASQFEAFYMSNQQCLEQLEMAERLYFGLKVVTSACETIGQQVVPIKNTDAQRHWWLKSMPYWAAAALFLVALLPSGVFYQELLQHNLPQAQPSVVSLSLSTTRSSQQQALSIQTSSGRTILSIYIDIDIVGTLYSSYGFTISKQRDPSSHWQATGLKSDQNDMLYIDLGTQYLLPGTYEYSIFGIDHKRDSQQISTGKVIVVQ